MATRPPWALAVARTDASAPSSSWPRPVSGSLASEAWCPWLVARFGAVLPGGRHRDSWIVPSIFTLLPHGSWRMAEAPELPADPLASLSLGWTRSSPIRRGRRCCGWGWCWPRAGPSGWNRSREVAPNGRPRGGAGVDRGRDHWGAVVDGVQGPGGRPGATTGARAGPGVAAGRPGRAAAAGRGGRGPGRTGRGPGRRHGHLGAVAWPASRLRAPPVGLTARDHLANWGEAGLGWPTATWTSRREAARQLRDVFRERERWAVVASWAAGWIRTFTREDARPLFAGVVRRRPVKCGPDVAGLRAWKALSRATTDPARHRRASPGPISTSHG
jgi:hypothetical protein